MFTGLAMAACAGPTTLVDVGTTGMQIAALPSGGQVSDVTLLPSVTVYTSGPRASSANTVKGGHFQVWAGYDADVALHPYTSNLGPNPEGTKAADAIKHSQYERASLTN